MSISALLLAIVAAAIILSLSRRKCNKSVLDDPEVQDELKKTINALKTYVQKLQNEHKDNDD